MSGMITTERTASKLKSGLHAGRCEPLLIPGHRHAAADVSTPQRTGIHAAAALWPQFALFLVGVGVILGATEAYLRRTGAHGAASVYRQPVPYIEFYQQPNYDRSGIVTNDVGFRSGPLPLTKPAHEQRVFFLSTSVGFLGASNDTTVAGFLERALALQERTAGGRIRVINASGVSFGTTQSLVLLVTRVLDYQPDVIVVFEGSEALFYATNYEARPGYPFNFSVRERAHARLTGQDPTPFPLLTALMQTETMKRFHPNLLRHALETTLPHQSTTITIDDPTGYDPYIDVVVRDIGRIARIASAYGCATIVAVPPIRADVLAPVALDRLTQRVKHMVEQRGAPGTYFVSMESTRNELTNGHWWRPDGLHWTDEANRLFADRFAQAIIGAGVLRQSILGDNHSNGTAVALGAGGPPPLEVGEPMNAPAPMIR